MNKKGHNDSWDILLIILIGLGVLFVLWVIITIGVSLVNGLAFDREAGSYCKLSYDASDIDKKVEYYDRCINGLELMELKGHASWFFKKPNNDMVEMYSVAHSLRDRMYNLLPMEKESFEYQKGLEQVEEELSYFVKGEENSASVLGKFGRVYCFKHNINMFCI